MNLFDLADQNSDSLKKRCNSLEGRCRTRGSLNEFNNFIKRVISDWRICMNMRERVLNKVLVSGRYKNIYEVKKDRKEQLTKMGKPSIPRQEAIKKHLGEHAEPRIIFDSTFEDGNELVYGALNIGGLGLTGFGPLCVVIKREQAERYSSLAFIKEDSEKYVVNDRVDLDRLKQDVSNKEHIPLLVALKHESDIERVRTDKWSSVICCARGKHDYVYVEAVTKDKILSTHIETVRMSEENYRVYTQYASEDYESEIDEDNGYRLFILDGIIILLEKLGIELEVI